MILLKCKIFKKKNAIQLIDLDNGLLVTRGKEEIRKREQQWGEMNEGSQKEQTFTYKINNKDVIYSMMTTVNNTILHK